MSGRESDYVIIRYGANRANQSMCERFVVGYVRAPSRLEAITCALGVGVSVFVNQYLEAIPWSRATVSDQREALEFGILTKSDHPCDLCGAYGIESEATWLTPDVASEFAGNLLRRPRRIRYCAACADAIPEDERARLERI